MSGDTPIREILIEIQDLQDEKARWNEILNQSQPYTPRETHTVLPDTPATGIPSHLIKMLHGRRYGDWFARIERETKNTGIIKNNTDATLSGENVFRDHILHRLEQIEEELHRSKAELRYYLPADKIETFNLKDF